jgi:integrase
MNGLRQALADYLQLRRCLGYKLERAEKLLDQFSPYLAAGGAYPPPPAPGGGGPRQADSPDGNWWAQRLSVVRGFTAYLSTIDPAVEVPPRDLLPSRPRRASPYLYSRDDVAALIAAATTLRSPLRVATYQALIGVLAVTGLRIGEAIGLDRGDVDLDTGVLIVRAAKLGKTRELPLHPTTLAALRAYLRQRDRHQPPAHTPAVFISPAGSRLLYCNVQWTFQRLTRQAGLEPRAGSCRPRIHDLRHSFAVHTLLDATATASTSLTDSRRCRPTWATQTRPAPTGTCPPHPS